MTTEQKLQAIIEAQVMGGYLDKEGMLKMGGGMVDGWRSFNSEFDILLDPAGLRAAYGDWAEGSLASELKTPKWKAFGMNICQSWLSSNGDVAATIDTAFSLLPSQR